MANEPAFFEDTDEGRAALLAFLSKLVGKPIALRTDAEGKVLGFGPAETEGGK